jgi:hypothetical protein
MQLITNRLCIETDGQSVSYHTSQPNIQNMLKRHLAILQHLIQRCLSPLFTKLQHLSQCVQPTLLLQQFNQNQSAQHGVDSTSPAKDTGVTHIV